MEPMSFLIALDEEIRSLRASLDNDARSIKLKELERVRALYQADHESSSFRVADIHAHLPKLDIPNFAKANGAGMPEPRRRLSPERQSAIEAVRQFIQGKTEPTKTVDLLAHLNAKGIEIGGSDPMNNLSALLSTSAIFHANGRSGWTLKPE
jgi:hypothetical protein